MDVTQRISKIIGVQTQLDEGYLFKKMLKQKLIKNRICSLILIDELNNINFDAYSINYEDLFKYRQQHFWEFDDGTFD